MQLVLQIAAAGGWATAALPVAALARGGRRGGRAELDRRHRRLRRRLYLQVLEGDRCLDCRTELQPHFRCCPGCGLELRRECPGCAELLDVAWRACPHCAAGGDRTVAASAA